MLLDPDETGQYFVGSANNIYNVADKTFLVTQDIFPGQELTKRYGCARWFCYLGMDASGLGFCIGLPSDSPQRQYEIIGKQKILPILSKCAKDLGYSLTTEKEK